MISLRFTLMVALCASILSRADEIDALRKQAETGNVSAQLRLGIALAARTDMASRGEAGQWLDKAGHAGEPRGFDLLVNETSQGHVVLTFAKRRLTNDEAAFYYAALAVVGGSRMNAARIEPAQLDVLRAAKDFDIVTARLGQELLAMSEHLQATLPDRAEAYLRAAADWGDAVANDRLGVRYFSGQREPQNKWLAFKYLRRAANRKNAEGFNDLAVLFESADGKRPLPVSSLVLLLNGAHEGSALACANLGGKIEQGYIWESDADKELRLPRDTQAALAWYKIAALHGDPSARLKVARALVPNPDKWARSKAAKTNPEDALNALAWANLAVDAKVPGAELHRDALKKLLTAEQLDESTRSETLLLINLSDPPRDTTDIDALMLKTFTDMSERQKSPVAQFLLGICYGHGWGTPVDRTKCYEVSTAAARHNISHAMVAIGEDLAIGQGTAKDPAAAATAYRHAAELGDAIGLYHLYQCYRDGTGVPKDEAIANRLLELSAFRGYGLAMKEHALSLKPDDHEERIVRCRDLLLAADALGQEDASAEASKLGARHPASFHGVSRDGWQAVLQSIYGVMPAPPIQSIYADLDLTALAERVLWGDCEAMYAEVERVGAALGEDDVGMFLERAAEQNHGPAACRLAERLKKADKPGDDSAEARERREAIRKYVQIAMEAHIPAAFVMYADIMSERSDFVAVGENFKCRLLACDHGRFDQRAEISKVAAGFDIEKLCNALEDTHRTKTIYSDPFRNRRAAIAMPSLDDDETLGKLKTRMRSGDRDAGFAAGVIYLNGIKGKAPNPQRAFDCFSLNGTEVHPMSAYNAGMCQILGIGCAKNVQAGLDQLSAARPKLPAAGYVSWKLRDVRFKPSELESFLLDAAKAGDVRAIEEYGWLLIGRDRATPADRTEGCAWAQLAIKRGRDNWVDRALTVKKRPTGNEWEAGKTKAAQMDSTIPIFKAPDLIELP